MFFGVVKLKAALLLYAAGFFAPERAQESMIALEMMDFEGKEILLRKLESIDTGNAL